MNNISPEVMERLLEIASNNRNIIRNSILTPDGTHLISRGIHDYMTHTDKNGEVYMVDGGNHYLKRSYHKKEFKPKETNLYMNDKFEILRKEICWGTWGKNPDFSKDCKYVPICELSDDHLANLLNDHYGSEDYRILFLKEVKWREENGESVCD